MPIFDQAHPKIIEITFNFPEFEPACKKKKKFIPSIHSWDTANFTILWSDWSHPFLIKHIQKCFDQHYVNLYQHAKNQPISLICSRIWDLCRNTANNINFHYRTNSVKINGKFFQYIKKSPVFGCFLARFPNFGSKKKISGNLTPSHTTSCGFLASFQNFEKTNDAIPRKCLDKWKDVRTDGRPDRPHFIGPFQLTQVIQQTQTHTHKYETQDENSSKINFLDTFHRYIMIRN